MLKKISRALFRPGMSAEVCHYIATYDICRTFDSSQPKETFLCIEPADRPWEKVAVDLFTFDNKDHMVLIDYYSNFLEVDVLESGSTSKHIIKKLKPHFARHGIPNILVSDNGPQLVSEEFENFLLKWDIEHVTSSPHNPQGNGKAEAGVKIAKRLLCKSIAAKEDPYLALLNHRNTPSEGIGISPAQRLMNRRCRTLLPVAERLLKSDHIEKVKERKKLQDHREKYAEKYNHHARDLTPLVEGDMVRMKPFRSGGKWTKATVVERLDERSYDILSEEGTVYRRNRRDIRLGKGVRIEPLLESNPKEEAIPNQLTQAKTRDPSQQEVKVEDKPETMKLETSGLIKPTIAVRKSQRNTITPSKFKDYVLGK